MNSSATLAAMPIYADAGTPVLCPSSSNPSITEQGWKNFIRLTGRDDYGAQEYSGFMINNLKKRKLGIFFVNNDFGRGLAQRDRQGGRMCCTVKIVAEGTFTPNVDRDFQPIITQMKSAGVEGLMLMTEYTEGGLFLAQAKDLGFTGFPVAGPDSNLYDKYIELSLGAAEGTYVLAAYDPFADNPATRSFVDAYQKAIWRAGVAGGGVHATTSSGIIKDAVDQARRQARHADRHGQGHDRSMGSGARMPGPRRATPRTGPHYVLQVQGKRFVSTGIKIDETGLDVLRKA